MVIAADSLELSHHALDALARGKSTAGLRAALVHAGVLERRDEVSATMSQWTADRLAALDPGRDATSVRAFANWKVARELAVCRARKPGPDPLATTMPKHRVTAAVELTNWLDAQQLGLNDLDQPLLDAWLADGPATRGRTARPFVAWLERIDHRGLRIPTSRASTRVLALDDVQRLAALRTLLHDDAIDSRLRLAGCLVALYAQFVARIVRLTAAGLQLTDAGPQIRLGREMAALPSRLRGVAELLLATTSDDGWLFPGQKAGHPTHPTHRYVARRTEGASRA